MIHTVHLDDRFNNIQQLLQTIRQQEQGVHFENATHAAPEGYMTVEQFRTEAKISLTKILNEHGIY
jgi:hypothetical protein